MSKQLIKCLNELCNRLDDEYYINDGGCCFISYVIASHLDRLGIKYKLVCFTEEYKNPKKVQEEVFTMSCNKSVSGKYTCDHYCIEIDGLGFVNPCIYTNYSYFNKYYVSNITSENILWLYKTGNWNECYNTLNNIKVIRIINNFFKSMKYSSQKTIKCPRCRQVCKHDLYNYEYGIYKCSKCGNIHAPIK